MPKVSVVIPCYNVEKAVSRSLNSVLNQTLFDFEIICVNDGSVDNTLAVLQKYAKKDNRILVVNQENKGVSAARNKGFSLSTGEYVFFLDSDDCIHPQLLEIAYTLAQSCNADVVNFPKYNVYDSGKDAVLPNYDKLFKMQNIDCLVVDKAYQYLHKNKGYKFYCTIWSKFSRRQFLQDLQFMESVRTGSEDIIFTYEMAVKIGRFILLNQPLYYYFLLDNSLSHKEPTAAKMDDYCKGLQHLSSVYATPELKKVFDEKIVPPILKEQYNCILRASPANKKSLLTAFVQELEVLQNKLKFSFSNCGLKYALIYKKMLRQKEKYAPNFFIVFYKKIEFFTKKMNKFVQKYQKKSMKSDRCKKEQKNTKKGVDKG